ncbi:MULTISPECIES: DNA helicase PcrA [Turicibacter]|uniref:ATP-dependent DNA helicase n=1 Tax=Turicibacter bilis TaxID=2735723 RepID=A0ABY5JFP5_9FIRM|nr:MULTISPECIES: DNA helicase PcrA [Turicibacter]MDD6761365.1 DNA helicase PcrA [Turicibacter sp.]AMC08784.1 ATP-dependent DNA helicase PcrA [Turicibacter sp. H121]MBS3201077.1 DNA helicase PcrA [Turicibacter bilis]MCU7200537.1 DNA helicase PcrA [Turicibacter sp. H121]MDY4814684.1 DNA helicase PcrA [Turicibacter bilis]
MSQLLDKMNPQQKEAILTTEGPLLVMAGAGSGKTRVLTHRIAYLMSEKQVSPYNILAITFTNKAAREMKERVEKLIGERGKDVWISTFHSMCVRILRRDIDLIGYDLNFGILDDADQLSVIKTVMEDLNLDPKRQSPKYFLSQISNAKNELKTPSDLNKEFENEDVIRVYEKYQQTLFKNNRVDFDDLLMLTVHLFEKHPEVLSFYQNKFQYIHIDEYQDTNHAQYKIVTLLAEKFRNICVVGDSDQSIYSWRGANIENILSFESDYPDASVVLLEQNYRSKQMILNAANDVIKNNSGRRDKQLWSDRGEGEAIEYHRASDGDVEANYIADKIAYMRRDAYDYHDFAVLYRTNSQSRAIEQALLRQNIPYRLVGGQSYFKRKEIKDLMAYLRLICNPDDDLSFVRVVNEPKRGIGAASIDKLSHFAAESELSLMSSIQDATGVVAKATLNKLMDFKTMIYMLRAQIEDHSLASFIDLVLSQTGYLEMLENENTIEADSRIDNLGEFKSMATQFEDVDLDEILAEEESEERADDLPTMTKLIILLNDLMLQTDTETEEEANESKVTLMTIHAAKGLEFPVVFICGFEDGIFPLRSAIEQGADDLEEERRLAYVAITRAEDLLFITNAQSRYQYGMRSANPESMFIREISETYLNKTGIESRPRPSFTLKEAMESKAPKRQIKTVSLNSGSSWNSGDKVEHDTFGEGVVVGVKGEVISIAFSAPHGIKKLMGSHPALKKRS